jgi:hypothetical protein
MRFTVARWPIFRPNNTKQAGKNYLISSTLLLKPSMTQAHNIRVKENSVIHVDQSDPHQDRSGLWIFVDDKIFRHPHVMGLLRRVRRFRIKNLFALKRSKTGSCRGRGKERVL